MLYVKYGRISFTAEKKIFGCKCWRKPAYTISSSMILRVSGKLNKITYEIRSRRVRGEVPFDCTTEDMTLKVK